MALTQAGGVVEKLPPVDGVPPVDGAVPPVAGVPPVFEVPPVETAPPVEEMPPVADTVPPVEVLGMGVASLQPQAIRIVPISPNPRPVAARRLRRGKLEEIEDRR
jgi:hypothetical protein